MTYLRALKAGSLLWRRARFLFSTPLLIFALNLFLSWRLMKTEYVAHFDSIEPFFYAIAEYLQRNWAHPGWWPFWNCGMPFRYTYQPLLHYTVAAVASLSGLSVPRAFHAVFALVYSLGPVALFAMTRRLTQSYRAALTAALVFSLCSPSAWLMPDIASDLGGHFQAQRLHAAVSYADVPNVCGLTLVLLAILAVDRAAERPNLPRFLCASLASVAVPLTNIPAAMTLAMAMVAYCLAMPTAVLLRRAAVGVGAAMLGYALVAPLIPPSGLLLSARNTQWMDPSAALNAPKAIGLAIGVSVLILISRLALRLVHSSFARFSLLLLLITATIVLGDDWGVSRSSRRQRDFILQWS